MMKCSQCSTPNRESRTFCAQCGNKLAFPCSRCHFMNFNGELFCGGCGQAFSSQAPPLSASSPGSPGKSSSLSGEALKALLDIQKGTRDKKEINTEEKKQVNQEEIERLIQSNQRQEKRP